MAFDRVFVALVAFLLSSTVVDARAPVGASQIKWRRLHQAEQDKSLEKRAATFPQYNFTQPLDHFADTGFTFEQRYWVSTRYYKPGGPVFVIDGGEVDATSRLAYMDTGILDILTNVTSGLGVVLEHRYYGDSVPVLNFTTDSLRWLNNEQAAADSANFISSVKFEGIDEDKTAPGTPWIYYGGSYAGARSAHMRVLYPELVYGAIASSGVVHATLHDWRYMDIIRQYAPSDCIAVLEQAIDEVDKFLSNPQTRETIKAVYGLPNITHDTDFVSTLSFPLGAWQDNNWDPAVGSTEFADFCDVLGTPDNNTVKTLHGITVSNSTAKFARYIIANVASECPLSDTQDECFGTYDPAEYQVYDLSQTWRLWQFQVCTQWGFFDVPPPNPQTPPIISTLITEQYDHQICELAYPPGEHFQVPPQPNISAVNSLGGYYIAADRLAIIDGEADPWRGDTAHSPAAPNRTDTDIRPFKLIPRAVHHYDENGLADHSQEPPTIRTIHEQEAEFVTAWLKNWTAPTRT